jgi:hypothetical protein
LAAMRARLGKRQQRARELLPGRACGSPARQRAGVELAAADQQADDQADPRGEPTAVHG